MLLSPPAPLPCTAVLLGWHQQSLWPPHHPHHHGVVISGTSLLARSLRGSWDKELNKVVGEHFLGWERSIT